MDSIKEKWDEIKETIRNEYELTDVSYDTWIKPLSFYDVKENVVIIMIPSDQAHALNYISSKYKNFFKVIISEMMDHTYDISFVLEKEAMEQKKNAETAEKPSNHAKYESANLNPKYKFDIGSSGIFKPLEKRSCRETSHRPPQSPR